MRVIRGIHNIQEHDRHCVATIGNFDGVHKGHQAVFATLKACASYYNMLSTVITFEPLPQEFLKPEQTKARLTRFREKCLAIAECGIQQLLCLPFNDALAKLSPAQFVQQIIVDGLDVKVLLVGDDFRFGYQRQGDFAYLQQVGETSGFDVEELPTFTVAGERVSSTRIRNALEQGDMAMAQALLARPYSIAGRIVKGAQRGRTIGVPTANIHLHRSRVPIQGVFAVRVKGLSEQALPGVANVGVRPTVDDSGDTLLEVHLLNFDADIYGRYVEVEFLEKLRDEQKFTGLEQLTAQLQQDISQCGDYFTKQEMMYE